MNIWGLKNKKQRAREMLNNELKKPRNEQSQNKIQQIEMGMANLREKIKQLKLEKKGRIKGGKKNLS